MPQQSLFEGFEGCQLGINLELPPEKSGGLMMVSVRDEFGRMMVQRSVRWERPRDIAGLPDAVKEVVNAWLWGSERDV